MAVQMILKETLLFPVECGIVAQISDPITAANISEYYISTYHSDHTLVGVECHLFDGVTCLTCVSLHPSDPNARLTLSIWRCAKTF